MILVTGGAGYIGSHVTRDLLDKGFSVVVLDNLTTGHFEAVDKRATFIIGDIGDHEILNKIFEEFDIDAVMHFAANCLVGESVSLPMKYYTNNVANTIQLINKMIAHKIDKLIFSSTCATYGIPEVLPISEKSSNNPINPYGKSKLMIEQILQDVYNSQNLNYVTLRYFNVAGAHVNANIGEDHTPETHLIPNILKHLQGISPYIEIFGNDHNTLDGTCIRDYIHVSDISNAHILALEYLLRNPSLRINEIFNLGTETGSSVLDIINACEEITGQKANIKVKPKREGDPPILVATYRKINSQLGWIPKYDLKEIISTAWRWHQQKPEGYKT
jgi:UDP-glucose 4-epimerase